MRRFQKIPPLDPPLQRGGGGRAPFSRKRRRQSPPLIKGGGLLLLFVKGGGLLLLFLLSACSARAPENGTGRYCLYFLDGGLTDGNWSAAAGEGALREENSAVSPGGAPLETAEALLAELLRGPKSENLRPAIPAGTKLSSLDLRGSRASVDFTSPYASLSGVSLTLADYAVALTLTQIPEISLVQITVNGQPLAYRDRQLFTARDVLLAPEGDVVGTVEVRLYFPNANGELTPEERVLSLYEGDTQVEAVAQAAEGVPESRELSAAFPEGFRGVRSVRLEEATCFVNLSAALLEAVPGPALSTALYALDLSLCSLKNVKDVRYLVDGEFLDAYNGVQLTEPYAMAGE